MKRTDDTLEISCETTGFSSPAENYVDKRLDPKDLLMPNPLYTYFLSACGDMPGVSDGDILVVDKSIEPKLGDKVIVASEGRFELVEYSGDSEIWGVVTFSIRKHKS